MKRLGTVGRPSDARNPRHGWPSFVCGCGLALIFMELVLHPFSGKDENGAGVEIRNYREGLSRAHFAPDERRVTGNPQIAGAPSVLIVGDSHVEAFQVWDRETMGSVLERRLRADGKQWNVVQYGWSGADGPDYVYAAPLFEKQFPSKKILLVMNDGDFVSATTETARLLERDGKVVAEPAGPGSRMGRPPSYGGFWARKIKESGLLYAAALRFNLEILPKLTERKASAKEGDSGAKVAPEDALDVIVRGLKEAYGDKLFILYTPEQSFAVRAPPEPRETALLAECKTLGMECRSLRERMEKDLFASHKLARGFSDSEPGVGHFNAHGHALIAAELYDWLNSVP